MHIEEIIMERKTVIFIFGLIAIVIALIPLSSISTAQGEALPPFKIVHLGDSYSAGNGARSESGDRNYIGVEGCFRSPTNWGSQFAQSLGDEFAVTYVNRACSGGVTNDILNNRDMDDKWKTLSGCPSPEYPDEEFYRDDSTLKCSRFIKPQIDAVDSSTDLVLITMGGNDVGFATIVKECYVGSFRDEDSCREAMEHASAELQNVESRLINIFGELRAKLRPDAKIVFVTYPYLTLDVEYILDDNWLDGESYDVTKELRAVGLDGDTHQRNAMETANASAGEEYIVLYEGTKNLFDGHEPDPDFNDENPNRWLFEFETMQMTEWYHSNPLGHENWARGLSNFGTFGATGGSFGTDADIDVAFVVDTTSSMDDDIAQVQADLSNLVNQLEATTDSYRVAVVSYRDFPERTGDPVDYPSRVDQTFTDDLTSIQAAIDSLTLGYGGDTPETVFSGIQAAIELPWRPGVTKIMIVIGDAPALSPEPISNLTVDQIIANSIAVDPVQVIGVDTYALNSNGALGQVSAGTGGSVIPDTSGLANTISEILNTAVNQPFAWIGQAYSGKIGQPILFDASGSYDPSGLPITLYEWDFDGDGVFDFNTTEATTTYVYDIAFNDYVVLRVTGEGGTALASARTVVNTEGFASQGDEEPCELDENGYSIIVNEERQFIRCTAYNLPGISDQRIFLPIILNNSSTQNIVKGTVTDKGNPVSGTEVFLRYYDGSSYSAYATATTDSNGSYQFTDSPTLTGDQRMYVSWSNSDNNSNRLSYWSCWSIYSDTTDPDAYQCDFDLKDIVLASPSGGSTISLPYTFYWNTRGIVTDDYELNIADLNNNYDPYWWESFGYTDHYTMNSLPSEFSINKEYNWWMWVYGPDGYGISYYYNNVTFSNTGNRLNGEVVPMTTLLPKEDIEMIAPPFNK